MKTSIEKFMSDEAKTSPDPTQNQTKTKNITGGSLSTVAGLKSNDQIKQAVSTPVRRQEQEKN